MKTALFFSVCLLLSTGAAFSSAHGDDGASPLPATVKIRPARVLMSQVRSWSSADDHHLLLTTNRREQYLIQFDRPCRDISRGPASKALVTDTRWLDRNSAVRILHRDLLPFGSFDQAGGRDFRAVTNAYSTLCPIEEITALGKLPSRSASKR